MRLRVKDHTDVIRFVQRNPFLVLKHIDVRKFLLTGKRPSKAEVLRSLLKIDEMDPHLKEVIRRTAEIRGRRPKNGAEIPPRVKREVQMLEQKLGQVDNVEEILLLLMKERQKLKEEDLEYHLRAAISLAIRILNDGIGRIY